jgi:hypothetical protein
VTETPAPTVPVENLRKALLGYRVLAWTTGLWLILLCYEMVAKYVYGVKVRWPIAKTIGVLLAGTIPLVGIIVEHFQTRDVKAKFGI